MERAFWRGADDHRLSVDVEIGVILSFSVRMDEQEIYVAEVTEVAFNEKLSDGTFRLDLPGMEL